MGLTPHFSLPFPEQSDPADVPTDIQQLAERLETVLDGFNLSLPSTGDFKPVGYPVTAGAEEAGWLLCDGREVSRVTYAALFAKVSTRYGVGNGATTFNLPDFKGRALCGYDAAQTEFSPFGVKGGSKTHTLTMAEMPAHSHRLDGAGGAGGLTASHVHTGSALANFAGPSNVVDQPHLASFNEYPPSNPSGGYMATGWVSTSHVHSLSLNGAQAGINVAGSGSAHTVLQPYTTANILIKT